MKSNLLSARELAKLYPMFSHVYYWQKAKNGIIPHVRVNGRYLFDPEKIQFYLDAIIKEEEGNYDR